MDALFCFFNECFPGRGYREERDYYYKAGDIQLSFNFITRTATKETRRFLIDYPVSKRMQT